MFPAPRGPEVLHLWRQDHGEECIIPLRCVCDLLGQLFSEREPECDCNSRTHKPKEEEDGGAGSEQPFLGLAEVRSPIAHV